MIALLVAVSLAATTGCGRDVGAEANTALLTTDHGDVEAPIVTAQGIDYAVTSNDYRRWLAAESALAAAGLRHLSDRIPVESVTEEAMDAVTESLEKDELARTAIESSGLSVSRYVRTTIALEQALLATAPDSPVQFRALPAENIIVADRHRADIEQARAASPARIVDSERVRPARKWSDDREGKKKKRGRGKAKGKRKG